MASKRSSTKPKSKSKSRAAEFLQKPRGVIHPRVQKVGPGHFGIVAVDCAKARSKWMLTDFYGRVLVAPTEVAHNRVELDFMIFQVREAMAKHQLGDCLVAVERTGRYHHPIKNAFSKASFDTRTVHPYATKQFRQPANPDEKTDDNDLAAIQRAAVNGFALQEAAPSDSWRRLKLCIRHRRDLVRKCSALACQIREHLDAALPGYAACFDKLWESNVAFNLVRKARAFEKKGPQPLAEILAIVLARLGVGMIPSTPSEQKDLT